MSGSGTGIVAPYNTHRGVDLDGAADWYSRGDPVGIADGQAGFGSFWFRIDGGDGTLRYLTWNQGARFLVSLTALNKLAVRGRAAAGGTVLEWTTTPTYLAGLDWHQLLFSYNLAIPVGSIYVDGAIPALDTATLVNGADIDYTRGSWGWGGTFGGGSLWDGGLSETTFHTVFVDLPDIFWRQRWRHPNGQPPNLGADGSVAMTATPLIYLAEIGGVMVNLGDGGAVVENGAPVLSADSPKDRWVASLNYGTMGRLQSMG